MKEKIKIGFISLVIGLLAVLTGSCEKDDNLIIDKDGNHYHSVAIGSQVWMVENLKTTRYSDGIAVPLVTDITTWSNLTTPAYCWYNNNEAGYKTTYGALYNWYTVNTGKLCPSGWHVPTVVPTG